MSISCFKGCCLWCDYILAKQLCQENEAAWQAVHKVNVEAVCTNSDIETTSPEIQDYNIYSTNSLQEYMSESADIQETDVPSDIESNRTIDINNNEDNNFIPQQRKSERIRKLPKH